jgi:hypothetical protein
MIEGKLLGPAALKVGPENLRALAIIVATHVNAAPDDAPLDDAALGKLHPYLTDPDILAAVKIAAGLTR